MKTCFGADAPQPDGRRLGETTRVEEMPPCDLCRDGTLAVYDGKTITGPWAFLCQKHFDQVGIGLGLGRGQRLVGPEPS